MMIETASRARADPFDGRERVAPRRASQEYRPSTAGARASIASRRGRIVEQRARSRAAAADDRRRAARTARRRRRSRARPACRARRAARRRRAPRAASGRTFVLGQEREPDARGVQRLELASVDVAAGRRRGRRRPAAAASRVEVLRADSCGLSPTMTSRASGRARASPRERRDQSGSWRRLKIEPTNSTSGSRGARRPRRAGASRPAGSTHDPVDGATDSRSTISPRENSESVRIRLRGARRLAREQPPARAFARREPLGVRDERDVVDGDDERHAAARAARCRPARRRRRADRRGPRGAGASAPTTCRGRCRRSPRAWARRSGSASTKRQRLRRVQHELVARASAVDRPSAQQLAEVAADAGRLAAAARARRSPMRQVRVSSARRRARLSRRGRRRTARRRSRPSEY